MTTRRVADLEIVSHGTEPDLESVFRLHYVRVTKLVARITGDPGRAEELAVEVFLRWPPTDTSDDRAITGWLTRIAINLALDEVRRRDRQGRLVRFAANFRMQPGPEDLLASQDQRGKVVQTLAKLKPREAELLTMRAEGMSYEELATVLPKRGNG